MEKHIIPIGKTPSQITTRSHWKRSLFQINGKLRRNYIHDMSQVLMQSYSEIGVFPHKYYNGEAPTCTTLNGEFYIVSDENVFQIRSELEILGSRWVDIAALEFDTKGIYLASATRSGCLTVHDFESLYYSEEDREKQLLHISLAVGISAVRWNPANQDEVACTSSLSNNEVRIFDIGYTPSEPTEVLRKLPNVNVHGSSVHQGLLDIALFSDGARVLASDTRGTISIWDRRASDLPQTGLTTNSHSGLTSIQLKEDQCVYGASKDGFIHTWDLRGGRSSSAFESHSEVHSSPLISIELASLLNEIEPLKAQSNIIPKEIHSIDINPSCPYQLGFHLDNDWSGVLDMLNSQVSHIHCPPPLWGGSNAFIPILFPRKPSWLPEHSIYAVGSTSSQGLYLLDFYPNTSSPCHVDYDDSKSPNKENRFVPLSECVTACAIHPLNGTIVAGTTEASLLMISQKHRSYKEEEDDDVEHS